jgi:hypothetical protein
LRLAGLWVRDEKLLTAESAETTAEIAEKPNAETKK